MRIWWQRRADNDWKEAGRMTDKRVAVLIVGAGVGGLATSTLLAHNGIHSLLVERRQETFVYPKARNLTFRSLEILRGLGLGNAVGAVAEHMSSMVSKVTLNSADEKPAIDSDAFFPSAERFSPEPFGRYCPQRYLEPILLAEARRLGSEVEYGAELASFSQDGGGVVATVSGRDGSSTVVHADYLIAADGTHSPIRRQLGIPTSGMGPLPMFIVFVYFRAPWRQFVPNLGDGDAVYVENPDVSGIFMVAGGDLGVFTTTYFPSRGETSDQFTAQRCREMLLRAIGASIDIQIIDVAPWQPHEQVADQFQCGRVFLVGDAAHTMPPFKGGGANTAIHSAQNLAWKLAAVLDHTAAPELLETYHTERHPVGRFAARQSLSGPATSFLRLDDKGPGLLPAEEERPFFYMIAGYRYRSSAVVTNQPPPADPLAVQLVEGEELRGEPGTRVPHAWVQRDGERVSTLDLLGPGFTLFTGDAGDAWLAAAGSASANLGVAVNVQRLGPNSAIRDIDREWARVTRLPSNGALLVRPDDFVGWRSEVLPTAADQELLRVISQILARV
jgi:putative polyketide hydroxylase